MGLPSPGALEVLNLFAHLLNQNLQFNRRTRHFDRSGFRSQRVGFTIEFLHEEVEAAAHCAARRQHAAHFSYVRGKPLDFLVDIHFQRVQRHFLPNASDNFLARQRRRADNAGPSALSSRSFNLRSTAAIKSGARLVNCARHLLDLLALSQQDAVRRPRAFSASRFR